ncbi:MAG: ABC transporter permease [Sedimentisphaerales bacterium]|nr:ABC transporter permease [Sedimentisphaerales bacterium]
MSTLINDIRHGIRKLWKNPIFTAVAVLTLALGIGANTAIFSLMNAVKIRSLPVSHPEQLHNLKWVGDSTRGWVRNSYVKQLPNNQWSSDAFSQENYCNMRDHATNVSDVMAMGRVWGMVVRTEQHMVKAEGMLVSGNCFQGWGLKPQLGRLIEPDHDRQDAEAVTVISYDCWKSHFYQARDIVGQIVVLNGASFTVIGVLPQDFHGPYMGTDIGFYMPIATQPLVAPHHTKGYEVMVRLKPETSQEQTLSELNVLYYQAVYAGVPAEKQGMLRLEMEDASQGRVRYSHSLARPLPILMGMVGIVLLLTCVNLAGLLLARGTARQRDLSICQALGAGRWRLIRQLLTETLLLALLCAAVGLLLATNVKVTLSRLLWSSHTTMNLSNDWMVFGFTMVLAVVTLLLFGLLPAFYTTRSEFNALLKDRSSAGSSRMRLGRSLVVVQVVLSLVLLTGAGLLMRTLANLNNIPIGFNSEKLLTFYLNPEVSGYEGKSINNIHQQVQSSMLALPGVESVTSSQGLALRQGSTILSMFAFAMLSGKTESQPFSCKYKNVGPGYLSTMGIPLLKGRDFTEGDNQNAKRVVILNEHLSQTLFGDQDPVGRPFPFDEDCQIIGICSNFKNVHIKEGYDALALFPYDQNVKQITRLGYNVRTRHTAQALIPQILKTIAAIDRNLLVEDIKTQNECIRDMTRSERLFASLSCGFAGIAVGLSCLGLYGLLAYQVTRRTQEIGIRMALGASSRQVLLPILRSGLIMVLIGVALGLPAVVATTRLIRSRLWGIQPHDPVTIIVSVIILLVVAIIAAWIPAHRAARVDPMQALRYE